MIGIGSYDTAELAFDFRKRHDLKTVRALYDADARSRRTFKILGQPAAVLLSADGKVLAKYLGELDLDDILKKI